MTTAYRFDNLWSLRAPHERVYAALADLEDYEHWWLQVREVHRIDGERARVRIRGLLPYTLDLVLTRAVHDEARGILRVDITGDLQGWSARQLSRHASPVQPGGPGHGADAETGALRHPAVAARQPRPHDAIRRTGPSQVPHLRCWVQHLAQLKPVLEPKCLPRTGLN